MENAVDALLIAAAVLIFVVAIGTSFSLFGTAKHTADSIITMRDRQAYLDAAELDNGILYTSSSAIQGDLANIEDESIVGGVTKNGDRLVNIEDIIATISRYSKEKYGVTIVEKSSGNVLARYDSNTEQIMSLWYNFASPSDRNTKLAPYITELIANTTNDYSAPTNFTLAKLEDLYEVKILDIAGNVITSSIECGAPWYGNEKQIQKRIGCDITGAAYIYNRQKYEGKNLLNKLNGKKIVEVTNEIDQSKYLEDGGIFTGLLQQYEMPTVEIVYIIY